MSELALNRSVASRRPAHLWVVGILSAVWNAFGAFDYLATKLELAFYVSQFTEQQRAYFYGFPSWMVAAWALGVWGALAGSVGLLLARGWAVWAFGVSLAGLAVSTVYNFGMSDGAEIMGAAGVGMTAFIWVVAVALFVYAMRQRTRGALR
jgi:hypothetical protein